MPVEINNKIWLVLYVLFRFHCSTNSFFITFYKSMVCGELGNVLRSKGTEG